MYDILANHQLWIESKQQEGRRADLSYADLSRADLSRADLSYADLSYADLRYADLSYADLSGVDLRYADLSYADLIIYQSGRYTAWVQKTNTRIGCRYHSNKNWRLFNDQKISDMAADALEWWIKNKSVIFAIMDQLEAEQ